jgi:hypothetical protein
MSFSIRYVIDENAAADDASAASEMVGAFFFGVLGERDVGVW